MGAAIRNQQSKTRPANTTQYAVGDLINESATVGTNWIFKDMASVPGGSGVIKKALLIDSVKAGTPPSANLLLFSVAPAVGNDNAANALSDAEMQNLVGVISFATGSMIEGGASGASGVTQVLPDLQYKCASNDSKLYGVLLAANTYTPASGEVFDIILEGQALN